MNENNIIGQQDPVGQKEPFKKFFSLFQCTLQQMKAEGASDYVLYVLSREAVDKGIIPGPYIDQFKQAVTRRHAEQLQTLLYRIMDYYSALPSYS